MESSALSALELFISSATPVVEICLMCGVGIFLARKVREVGCERGVLGGVWARVRTRRGSTSARDDGRPIARDEALLDVV